MAQSQGGQAVTIEQRIINVAEKQNYYDSRELRAIALEVRKREDRIKQLEDHVVQIEKAGDELICYLSHRIETNHSDSIWHSASIKWGKAKKDVKP
jgi:hypothetical protein